MKKKVLLIGFMASSILLPQRNFAQESPKVVQEEESAELYLEEYTDKFQETFFEALKQKGIQNYDRAINLFLECKQMQSNTATLDYELSKVFFLDKKYVLAEQYALEALKVEPTNYWMLHHLISVLDKQGAPLESLESDLPFQDQTFLINSIKIYFEKQKYGEAKSFVLRLPKNRSRVQWEEKINEVLITKSVNDPEISTKKDTNTTSSENSELDRLKSSLKALMNSSDFRALETSANEALQSFPLQPEFHYYYGFALNQLNRSEDAIGILEEGLSLLFEESQLSNEFYTELSKAFTAMGNLSKANEYLSKIKPGF